MILNLFLFNLFLNNEDKEILFFKVHIILKKNKILIENSS
jgi:hypothetical protein